LKNPFKDVKPLNGLGILLDPCPDGKKVRQMLSERSAWIADYMGDNVVVARLNQWFSCPFAKIPKENANGF